MYICNVFLFTDYTNGQNQELWIGLYSDDAEVSWKWTDGSSVDYLPWTDDYPFLSTQYNSTCAYIRGNIFYDYIKDDNFFYMCKKPQQSFMTSTPHPQVSSTPAIKTNCSEGWVYFEATHSCYGLMQTDKAKWAFAEGDCQTHGANLASIHSSEEADFVSNSKFFGSLSSFGVVGFSTLDSGRIPFPGPIHKVVLGLAGPGLAQAGSTFLKPGPKY